MKRRVLLLVLLLSTMLIAGCADYSDTVGKKLKSSSGNCAGGLPPEEDGSCPDDAPTISAVEMERRQRVDLQEIGGSQNLWEGFYRPYLSNLNTGARIAVYPSNPGISPMTIPSAYQDTSAITIPRVFEDFSNIMQKGVSISEGTFGNNQYSAYFKINPITETVKIQIDFNFGITRRLAGKPVANQTIQECTGKLNKDYSVTNTGRLSQDYSITNIECSGISY